MTKMAVADNNTLYTDSVTKVRNDAESVASAISWSAIIGGAFAAAAVSLILLALGSGIGFASFSPWSISHASVASLTVKAIIWMIVMQWLSSAMGGYITGRLRTKWVGLHTDEVFFRDTAHGFLTWALATVLTAVFLTAAASEMIGGGMHMANVAVTKQASENESSPTAYFIDSLFRTETPGDVADSDAREVANHIFINDIAHNSFPESDKSYLAQLVADQTGIDTADAAKRVDDVIANVTIAEQQAKKTASTISLFTAFSLVIGAFIACIAGALGGKERDNF